MGRVAMIRSHAVRILRIPSFWFFMVTLITAFVVGRVVSPVWTVEKVTLAAETDQAGRPYIEADGDRIFIEPVVPYAEAALNQERGIRFNAAGEPAALKEFATETLDDGGHPAVRAQGARGRIPQFRGPCRRQPMSEGQASVPDHFERHDPAGRAGGRPVSA